MELLHFSAVWWNKQCRCSGQSPVATAGFAAAVSGSSYLLQQQHIAQAVYAGIAPGKCGSLLV